MRRWVGWGGGEGTQKGAFEARPPRKEGFHPEGKPATIPECCPCQARFDTKAETQPPLFPMSDLAFHTAQPCSCTASAAALLPGGPMLGQEHQHAKSPCLEPPSVPLQGFLNSAAAVLLLTWTTSNAIAMTWQQALASLLAFEAACGLAGPV